MSETNHDINISSVGYVDKKVFDVGAQFCEPLGDIVPGRQYRESRKLPAHERELRAMFDDSDPEELYAEDRIVIVDEVNGHSVYTSELYRGDGDELISGRPRPLQTVTPEGWFVPERLIRDEEKATGLFAEMGHLITGYLSPTEGTSVGVMDLVVRKKRKPEIPQVLKADPPTQEEQDRYYG
jgi:hypothetical protein